MMSKRDMLLLAISVVAFIFALSFGLTIKDQKAEKQNGFKAVTGISATVSALSLLAYIYFWYQKDGGKFKASMKQSLPSPLRGGSAYQRY